MLTTLRFSRKEIPATKLGDNLRRIFQERGTDFFEKNKNLLKEDRAESEDKQPKLEASDAVENLQLAQAQDLPKVMTVEELFAMRSEILPQLLYVTVNVSLTQ